MKILLFSLVLLASPFAFGKNPFPQDEESVGHALVCNGGDMIISRERKLDGNEESYTLYLYDKEAIFYFVEKSAEVGPGSSIDLQHALEVMVPYRLPQNVQYYAEIDGAVMWISGLAPKAGGRKFTSYEYGPRLKQVADGYELILSGVVQTPHSGLVYYKLGSWFFKNCVLKI